MVVMPPEEIELVCGSLGDLAGIIGMAVWAVIRRSERVIISTFLSLIPFRSSSQSLNKKAVNKLLLQ